MTSAPTPISTRPPLRMVASCPEERVLPMDLAAEQATLGSLMIDRDAIVAVGAWLRPEHFVLEKHALLYQAILTCYHERVPPDIRTVSDALRRHGWLEAIGGVTTLITLSEATPTAVHVEYYARIVERTAMLRRLIQAGGQIAALGYDERLDDAERVQQVRTALDTAFARPGLQGAASAAAAVEEVFALLTSDHVQYPSTGLRDLDDLLDGLHPGDLLLLGGRPAMGKTSLALQLLLNLSARQHTTLFCSLEMDRTQLMQRLLASQTGIALRDIRRHQLTDAQTQHLTAQLGVLSRQSFYLDETSGLTIDELRIKATAIQAEVAQQGRALDLIIIDYLQLMRPPDRGRRSTTANEDVSAISRGLKQLARDLRVPILALSQLSRAVEGRASHVPMLADLRDSGSLEQDADIVMFVYREDVYHPETPNRGIAEIHVAKHRNGPLGVVPVQYDAATQRWRDLSRTPVPMGA